MKPLPSIQLGRETLSPEMVKCPVCQKVGYTDERHQIDGAWPCAKHYLEIQNGDVMVWAWEVKKTCSQ
jgi:hypothetical protein